MPPFKLRHTERLRLNLTAMLNCSLLLVFFLVLTLHLTRAESEAPVRGPAVSSARTAKKVSAHTLHVRLTADTQGELLGIRLDDQRLGSLQELQGRIRKMAQTGGSAVYDVEFDCHYGLHYAHVLRAIAAVSSCRADDGTSMLRLIEQVKFAPPRRDPAEQDDKGNPVQPPEKEK